LKAECLRGKKPDDKCHRTRNDDKRGMQEVARSGWWVAPLQAGMDRKWGDGRLGAGPVP